MNNTKASIEKLINPDKLIIDAKNDLKDKTISYRQNFEGLVVSSPGIIDIAVSPNNITRALLFADTFIKSMRHRGHDIIIDKNTKVLVNNIELIIDIREKRIRKKRNGKNWDSTFLEPCGILSLRLPDLHPIKEWSDSATNQLEEKIPMIINKLELQAKEEKEKAIEREIWYNELKRKRKIEEEIIAKKDFELKEFKGLFQKANRWHQAEILRKYAAEVEKRAIEKNNLTDEVKKWLEWVNQKIEWYDPFIEKEDEIFHKVDRDTLEYKR